MRGYGYVLDKEMIIIKDFVSTCFRMSCVGSLVVLSLVVDHKTFEDKSKELPIFKANLTYHIQFLYFLNDFKISHVVLIVYLIQVD